MLTADQATAREFSQLRRHLARTDRPTQVWVLRGMATEVRRHIVGMIDAAQLGHIGGDLSVTDILATLFGAVLDVDPARPDRPDRDRFILSKGHCAGALYATLAHCGFFPREELDTFMAPLSHAQRPSGPHEGPGGRDEHRARWATGSPSPSGARSRLGCRTRRGARSSCSATASCRRAATGRPR